jgi:hypothetical protein
VSGTGAVTVADATWKVKHRTDGESGIQVVFDSPLLGTVDKWFAGDDYEHAN